MYTNARQRPRPRRATHLHLEQRATDRRQRRASFVIPERRTGFDRRTPFDIGPLRKAFETALRLLRDSGPALLTVLAMVNVLNLLDYVFTVNALAAGMSEGNPIMDRLFAYDVRLAGLIKIAAMLGVTLVIWRNRRYRLILGCAVLTLGAYIALMTYHLYGAAMFY